MDKRIEAILNAETSLNDAVMYEDITEGKLRKLDTYFEGEHEKLKAQLRADNTRMLKLNELANATSFKEYAGETLYGLKVPKKSNGAKSGIYIALLFFLILPISLALIINDEGKQALYLPVIYIVFAIINNRVIPSMRMSAFNREHLKEIQEKAKEEWEELNSTSVANYNKAYKKLETEVEGKRTVLEVELETYKKDIEKNRKDVLNKKAKVCKDYGISINHSSDEMEELITMINEGYRPTDAEYELRRRKAELDAYAAQEREAWARQWTYKAQAEAAERTAIAQEQMARDNAEALKKQGERTKAEEARRANARRRYADASAVASTGVGRGFMSGNKEIAEMEKARALADLL